jgi:hypothetical protein
MISFTIPTNNLESEISTLLAELQAKQEAVKQAKKLEKQATSIIEKLADTVEALKAMPEQLESLRASITALFPQPEATPVNDEPLPIIEAVEALQRGDFMVEVPKVEAAPEPQPEVEPTPQPEVEADKPKSCTELKQLSKSVSYLVNYRGEILSAYVASNNAGQLRKLAKDFIEPLAKGWNLRTEGDRDKRTTVTKYEIRILDLSLAQIKKLAAQVDNWTEESQPQPTVELPEFTLILDTSADSLLGEIWGVHGIGNDRRQYGTVREHLMQRGTWLNNKQRDTNGYPSKEDAARALVAEWAHNERLNSEMNQAIANRFMEPESPKTLASF